MTSRLARIGLLLLVATIVACDLNKPSPAPTPAPISPTGATSYSLTIRVTQCGSPFPDVPLKAVWGSGDSQTGTTDADGVVKLTGLSSAQLTVTVSPRDLAAQTQTVLPRESNWLPFYYPCVAALHVVGTAIDDEGAPLPGVSVLVENGLGPKSTGTTDASGRYDILWFFPAAFVKATLPGYEQYFTYLYRSAGSTSAEVTQDLHLYRIKRINAGESTMVTIVPGDAICGFSDELACRFVRVILPTTGTLTLSCEPRGDDNGGPGLTIVGYNDRGGIGPRRLRPGEYTFEIGMWWTSTVSQSCLFTTSLTPDPVPFFSQNDRYVAGGL